MDYLKIGDMQFVRQASAPDNRLDECSTHQQKDLDQGSLEFDTLTAKVYTTTLKSGLVGLPTNTPVVSYRDDNIHGVFLSTSVSRIGPNTYEISARAPLSVLAKTPHPGGVYTGQTVAQVVSDICGALPVYVKSNLANIKLYGWLPYCKPPESSARDNLAQVLFAIGAYLGVDLDGVLRVEPLWDGVASTIPADRLYQGASVEYGAAVTAVTVTEHQFAPTGGDPTTLFEGTAQAGDVITFDEPMYDLQVSGFSILESNANYAKLSAGVGTLTGRPYLHITREITEPVSDAQTPNEQSVTDATLVSLVNATAVARRLAEYYRCRETISSGVVAGDESPGHVVSVYHPYDKTMTTACIMSMDTVLSHILRAETKALVGFRPPQPENAEIYENRLLVTTTQDVVVPDGVTRMHIELGGAGQGGQAGADGEPGTAGGDAYIRQGTNGTSTGARGNGGRGGLRGSAGMGGRVLSIDLDVNPGDVLHIEVGAPGRGGQQNGIAGSVGGDTTLTVNGYVYSSASGSSAVSGYVDPVTGEIFAAAGIPGENGADGGNSGSSEMNPSGQSGKSLPNYPGGSGGSDNVTESTKSAVLFQSFSTKSYSESPLSSELKTGYEGYTQGEEGQLWIKGSRKTIGRYGPAGIVYDNATNGDPPSETGKAFSQITKYESVGTEGVAIKVTKLVNTRNYIKYTATAYKGWLGAGGGGAAKGAAGGDAKNRSGGAGATGTPAQAQTMLGGGGNGGNGGGGGGGGNPAYASISKNMQEIGMEADISGAPGGAKGLGTPGSDGGGGFAILFFGELKTIASGPLVTSKGKWFLDKLGRRFIV